MSGLQSKISEYISARQLPAAFDSVQKSNNQLPAK